MPKHQMCRKNLIIKTVALQANEIFMPTVTLLSLVGLLNRANDELNKKRIELFTKNKFGHSKIKEAHVFVSEEEIRIKAERLMRYWEQQRLLLKTRLHLAGGEGQSETVTQEEDKWIFPSEARNWREVYDFVTLKLGKHEQNL